MNWVLYGIMSAFSDRSRKHLQLIRLCPRSAPFFRQLFFFLYLLSSKVHSIFEFQVCHSNKNTNLNPTQKYTYLNFFSNSPKIGKNLKSIFTYFISLNLKSRTKRNLIPTSFFIFSFAPWKLTINLVFQRISIHPADGHGKTWER